MNKIFALFAAVLTAALPLCASPVEINGSLERAADGSVKLWRLQPGKVPGKMEYLPGPPAMVKITGVDGKPATFVGPNIPVRDNTPVKLTVTLEKGCYAIIGIYLFTEAGNYISSRIRHVNNAPGTPVTVEFSASDPTGKGFRVGKIAPFIQVRNNLSASFGNIKLDAETPAPAAAAPTGNALVVRMLPSGYRDDKTGSVYSDAMSLLHFPVWTVNAPFTDPAVKFTLTLPEKCRIIHAADFRNPLAADKIACSGNVWTLDFGRVCFRNRWQLRPLSVWAQFVPLTFTNFTVFIEPEEGALLPEAFEVPWKLSGTVFPEVSGVMKLRTLPAPKLKGDPGKMVWTGFSSAGQMWNTEVYRKQLRIFADAGANGLIDTKSGYILPEHALPAKRLKPEFGLTPVMMQMFNATMRPTFEQLKAKGVPVTENDLMLNAAGQRETSQRTGKTRQIYCFTAMAEPDSPVRRYMVGEYRKEAARGFEYFYPDYEPWPYNDCWCDKCRRAFAAEAGLDAEKVLAMKPAEIVASYPLRYWEFSNRRIAKVFALLNKEVGAKVGWNSCLVHEGVYFPPFRSYGFAAFAEDPRIYDDFAAFHNIDSLMTATRGISCVEAYVQNLPDGTPMLKKPLIARASSLVCNNWGYIVVLGHHERLRERDFTGMGMDYRREMQKLEIVGDFALGVDGVEVDMKPEAADAAAMTGIVEGLQYAANYRGRIDRKFRRDHRAELRIFDATAAESPFDRIGPKGSLGRYIWQFIKLHGPVQGFVHGHGEERLVTLLNWDFYQDKKIRVELDDLAPGGCINVDSDGREHYTFDKPFDKGFAMEIPAGSYAVVAVGKNAGYPTRPMPDVSGGRLMANGPARVRDGLKPFIQAMNNLIRTDMRKYPEAGFKLFDPEAWSSRENDL